MRRAAVEALVAVAGATLSRRFRICLGCLLAGVFALTTNVASAQATDLPVITTQPRSQSVAAGTFISLFVLATGTAPLSFQWRRNGVDLVGFGTRSIIFSFVAQTSDAGDFSVVVTNGAGSIVSETATLTVSVPAFITTQPKDQTADVGSTATFTVGATGDTLSYRWVRPGDVVVGTNSPTLTLTDVKGSDAGYYSVYVSNSHSAIQSIFVRLTVNGTPAAAPPEFSLQPVNQTVVANGEAHFSATAIGSPTPTQQWQVRSSGGAWTDIADGGTYSGAASGTLRVVTVMPALSGLEFRCVATNNSGVVNSSPATLTVKSADYAGTYFGTFATNHGRWALKVNTDNTAVYIAYLTSQSAALVSHLTINADGTFDTTGIETALPSTAPVALSLERETSSSKHRAAASSSIPLSGQIVSGAVTGQLTGLGETFSGTIDSTAGSAASGSYTAAALNTASGATYAIVAPSGQAFVLVVSTTIDSASGTVGSNNQLTATTASGGQLSLTLNSSAHSLAATVTPAGSTTPISFAGLSDTTASTAHLVNIAARAFCSTDNRVTIGGFVISGSVAKRVLVRAVGPSLTAQGIDAAEVLLDPTIEVHDALHGNSVIAANDNWADNANAADITAAASAVGAAALLGTDTKSSALLLDLVPGVYSFIVNGQAATSGIVLLEVYDADTTSTGSTFANIATRAFATTGNGVTIGGFVLSGNAPKHVLLRAVGPTLATQGLGVAEVLTDPTIELHDALNGNTVIATNDNWGDNANAAAITTTGARIGATPFDGSDAKSAALLLTLQPGVYSFIASGKPSAPSGIVLVEVYDAD